MLLASDHVLNSMQVGYIQSLHQMGTLSRLLLMWILLLMC